MRTPLGTDAARQRADHYRRLERRWQDEVGWRLLDIPHEQAGSAAVVRWQFDRIVARLDLQHLGVLVEVGCGHGHLLAHLRAAARGHGPTLVGVDLSHAVYALSGKGFSGVRADGEVLPFRDASITAMVYDGALHHLIDYRAALREAYRVLTPGGRLILLEPVTSPFTRFVTKLRDRLAPQLAARESPIDLHYREYFREDAIVDCLSSLGMDVTHERTDFLAYPITGAYSSFSTGRSARLMRALMAFEGAVARAPGMRRVATAFAWRFMIAATKAPAGVSRQPDAS